MLCYQVSPIIAVLGKFMVLNILEVQEFRGCRSSKTCYIVAVVNLVFDYFAKNKVRAELAAAVSSIEVISNLSIADSSRFKYEYSC